MSKKSYKFRLYPTKKQIEQLQWTLDRCRELYNAALQERKEIYTYTGKGTTYNQQAMQLPKIKEIREEYQNIHSQVLQLEPSKMSRTPQPKQDEETGQYLPNGASQKAGLNKSIVDAGWSTFISLCEYKAACAGVVQVVKVDPYKTSQVCSGCLHEGPHKDLSERVHTCENCGLVLDRDVNAAVNILAVAQGLNLRPIKKTKKVRARTEPPGDAPLRSPRL